MPRPTRNSGPGSPCLPAAIEGNREPPRRRRPRRRYLSWGSNSSRSFFCKRRARRSSGRIAPLGRLPGVNRDPEAEAAAGHLVTIVEVLDPHPSVVRLDDAAAQLQTDAHPLAFGAVEGLIDAVDHFRWHTLARVLDREFDHILALLTGRSDAQFDVTGTQRPVSLDDGLAGVLDQVDDHLLDQDWIDHERGQARCHIRTQSYLVAPQ